MMLDEEYDAGFLAGMTELGLTFRTEVSEALIAAYRTALVGVDIFGFRRGVRRAMAGEDRFPTPKRLRELAYGGHESGAPPPPPVLTQPVLAHLGAIAEAQAAVAAPPATAAPVDPAPPPPPRPMYADAHVLGGDGLTAGDAAARGYLTPAWGESGFCYFARVRAQLEAQRGLWRGMREGAQKERRTA